MKIKKGVMKKENQYRRIQIGFVRIMSFFIIGLMINLTIISSVFAADSTSFGGAIPSSFTGSNYAVYGASVNPQFSQPSFYGGDMLDVSTYWTNFNKEDCSQRQDVILTIPPGGCSPSVVRSDLLEEQNVPVFCKVSSIQVNPLIDITKIRSIHFTGEYPKGISGLSYYPAQVGIRSTDQLVGSPVIDNVGYLVVVLKKTPNEKDMPDWLQGNVTAVIDYDSEGVFGVGEHEFFLPELNDERWTNEYKSYSFWKGKGFVRAEAIDAESARISIYKDAGNLELSVDLKKGETSRDLYLDGFYCAAGMNIQLEDITYPVKSALLRVDDEELWLTKGSRFLDGRCTVRDLQINEIGTGKVSISCPGARFDLLFNKAVARFEVEKPLGGKQLEDDYAIGDKITTREITEYEGIPNPDYLEVYPGPKNPLEITYTNDVYLAYSGKYPDAKNNYNVLVAVTSGSEQFKGLGEFIYSREKMWQSKSLIRKVWSIGPIDLWDWVYKQGVNVEGDYSKDEVEYYKYLVEEIADKYPELSGKNLGVFVGDGASWIEYGIKLEKPVKGNEVLNTNSDLKEYYEKAIKEYDELVDLYPNDKFMNDKKNTEESYAAQALSNAAELAGMLGLKEDQKKYLEKLITNYPGSNLAIDAGNNLKEVYDERFTKDSQAVVYVNNEPHFISLTNLRDVGYEDAGAELSIEDTKETKIEPIIKDQLTVTDKSNLRFKIKDVKENSVDIEYYDDLSTVSNIVNYVISPTTIGKTKTIELGKTEQITKDVTIRVNKINLKKQAVVKIIPKVFGTRTESDFSFKIGIEKRGIKLSPKKTQEMIDNLDEIIKKWESVNEKLAKVVKGLKAACFATSALLTVKNLFSGMSGESMARNAVMTSRGGWNEKCEQAIANKTGIAGIGPFTSVDNCLLKMDQAGYIKKDIDAYAAALKKKNTEIAELQKPLTKKTDNLLDFEGQVDYEQLRQKYCKEKFIDFYNKNQNMEINLRGEGKKKLNEIINETRVTSENCDVDLSVMRELTTFPDLAKSGDTSVLYDVVNNNLGDSLLNTYQMNSIITNRGVLKEKFGEDISVFNVDENVKSQVMSDTKSVAQKYQDAFNKNPDDTVTKVFADVVGTQSVLVGLANKKGDRYTVKKVLDSAGNDITKNIYKKVDSQTITYGEYYSYYKHVDEFTIANAGMYKNPMKGDVKVKYYESAPYKGLPQLVPFDRENGWYVTTDYILSGFGQPYQDNGRAVNFWICNVGENGIIEGKNRDDCRLYNLGSTADLDFPGLSKSESAVIVRKAETAIRQASEQYGKTRVVINNQVFDTGIAVNGETGRCSDFMSPSDCNMMFNVCDPVICPESRCDFGGKYRVDNVIQSGIIGSLMLCLPNAKEGIIIPICLSGVSAGIDGYLSILKSAKACLNESLATGQNIGICDEIKSIYLCDFFWRQAVPLMDVAIPKLFETLVGGGQGTRGGGEYLTVQTAWDNAKKSMDWFKDEYAVNSMKAFNLRSTADVGGEICKSFVSARYPGSKDFFDNLIEPDSPVQYSAWFSEDVLTEATIPTTSHYKVYYHIYAGKDIGNNYLIYLKNPPESSYVHTLETYVVDRGYVERGQQVDQAKDFTAVSGYTELCVNINGQEKCGFKQVSTSWAINQIANNYAAEQASQTDISTSTQCVAGETSLYSLAQPNLQAGAQEAISPELYKRGVIRVCSSQNPGKAVLPSGELDVTNSTYDRWKEVGYCDDQSIRCWLDTKSVKNVLADAPGLLNETLDQVNLNYLDSIDRLTEPESKKIVQDAKKAYVRIGLLKAEQLTESSIQASLGSIESDLDNLAEKGPSNSYRAQALLWKGRIYGLITKKIYYESGILSQKAISSIEREKALQLEEQKTGEEIAMEEVQQELGQEINQEITKGFVLETDNKIIFDGNDTGLYVKGSDIMANVDWWFDSRVGGITSDGKILFTVSDKTSVMSELEKYKLRGRIFVPK
ncbi:MAG: hypothetical protein PHH54_04475 [Candidatus Nanoarchaeia archaeon]|nr:hypothetical protein [Candidatus Nanoarchaeia archaeon]MDD5741215.1 hypothetical protein [Candidatus Nanoarchaeia archaeon]